MRRIKNRKNHLFKTEFKTKNQRLRKKTNDAVVKKNCR